MTTVTVRDLRYKFPEIEARLRRGEVLELRKRKEVLGRLVPALPAAGPTPEYAAMQRAIFGKRRMKVTAASIIRASRDEGH
ncbi:MAG TPA: hypothetical protein VIC54_03900 [Terriglobales bacterium]|jgi:antitoxin (DNA-binding transcriptional repressor) of toxin-antitoxin stability system